MTIDTSRVETGLLTRLRSIANRYRAWRITEDQMQREVRQAIDRGENPPPILTPKPNPPMSAADRRFFGRWWGSSIKHRDPRYDTRRKPRHDEF